MAYSNFILTVNSSSIIILLVLAAILLSATRFRGENGYAAAIIVLPNVPVYLYNMSRMLGWHDFSVFMFPISNSVNTLLMPLLWLFAKKNFDPDFRFRPLDLLHFAPCLICAGMSITLSPDQRMQAIIHEMSGEDTWIGNINTLIVFLQMIGYFTAIFRFLHRTKKTINNTLSDAEWVQKEWIVVFECLFAALFVIVMICYVIWPRTDAWLIQILNVVAMFYLVYNSIAHPILPIKQIPTDETLQSSSTADADSAPQSIMSELQMQEVCELATRHMEETKAFLRPDISLALFAKEINVSQRTLSRAINGYLKCNFFEFVNRKRVEEAKRLLSMLDTKDYNIDSIYSDCGFRSRSTFYMVFKKMTGKTPVAWLDSK